jgi:hypothetical protein
MHERVADEYLGDLKAATLVAAKTQSVQLVQR